MSFVVFFSLCRCFTSKKPVASSEEIYLIKIDFSSILADSSPFAGSLKVPPFSLRFSYHVPSTSEASHTAVKSEDLTYLLFSKRITATIGHRVYSRSREDILEDSQIDFILIMIKESK